MIVGKKRLQGPVKSLMVINMVVKKKNIEEINSKGGVNVRRRNWQ